MYETHESNIEWGKIIKKGSIILGAILLILILFTLVTKLTKRQDTTEPEQKNTPTTLSEQLDIVEDALLKYIDLDTLPKDLNGAKTIRIKLLKEKGLIQELTDSQKNSCESNGSFAEITRFEENYAVSITLTCGTNKENRLIYIGCFEECDGKICKGNAESKGGICTVSPVTDNQTKPSTNNNSTNNTNKNQNTTTKKPSNNTTTTKPSNTQKPTTPSKPNNSNNNQETPKQTMYEFKKCTTNYICSTGVLNKTTNKCEYGTTSTTSYCEVKEDMVKSSRPTLSSENTNAVKYQLYNYKNGYYYYKIFHCADSSYTYSFVTNKCSKQITEKLTKDPEPQTSCDYTWSYASSIDGWTKTGKTK